MFRRFYFLTLYITLILQFSVVEARVVFTTEDNGIHDQVFYIDSGDTADDFIDLEFGQTIDAKLRYDVINDNFELNRNTNFAGNELLDARIENLAIAPACDAAAGGKMYYNTANTNSYVCNGATWEQIDIAPGALGDLLSARYRDSSTTDINASATNNLIPWGLEDFEDAGAFVHDTVTNNSQIQVLSDGKYMISGAISVENTITGNFRYNGRVKFRVNGVTVLPMRFQPGYIRMTSGQTETSLVFSTILDLTANDYFEILVDRENTTAGVANMISGQSSLSVVQLKAPQGPAGPTGSNGADGDITWQGAWVSQNYVTNQAVSYNGSSYVCILNTVSNELPTNSTYWDVLSERGSQGLPGTIGGGTNSETFVIDQDDTGGGLSLQFGTILAESLYWDNTNLEFSLTDNLNIEASAKALELGDGTASDVYINFDDGVNRQFGWDDAAGNFSTFGEDIESTCGPYGIFWAERGTVVSNTSWALGNGQTPWGSPMGCNGVVKRLAATCTGGIGTSLSAVLRKNNVATTCTVNISTIIGQATVSNCNESFLGTDVLGVYAGTETGAWSECVGTFWVKYN